MMKTKEKPCKGTGKAKDFQGCGVQSLYRRYGLCNSCYRNWLLNTEEGKKKIQLSLDRTRKKLAKEESRKLRERRLANVNYKVKLQDKINEIVRLIDIGLLCLARGTHAGQIHGGHIFSRGSSPQMKYNLHNIHRQSAQSNHYQNEDGLLRDGLKKEYGEDYYNFLSSMQGNPVVKYSNEEYREFYNRANKIARDLKKQGKRWLRCYTDCF